MSIVHVIHFIHHTGHFAEITGPFVDEEELPISTAPSKAVVWLGYETCDVKWGGFL